MMARQARASALEWKSRVDSWRRSGESATSFASRHGWNAKTLWWWGAELERRASRGSRPASAVQTPRFVELVQGPEAFGEAASLELVLSLGAVVRVSKTTDLGLLRAVVAAVGGQ